MLVVYDGKFISTWGGVVQSVGALHVIQTMNHPELLRSVVIKVGNPTASSLSLRTKWPGHEADIWCQGSHAEYPQLLHTWS